MATMEFLSETVRGFTLRLRLTQTEPSSLTNTSKLGYTLDLLSTDRHFTSYGVGAKVILDGTTVALRDRYTEPQLSTNYNSTLTLLSGSTGIAHSADGTKTVSVAFSIDMASDAWTPGPVSVTGKTMTLDPIARESTVAATDANIGSVSTVTVSRKNSAFTHTLAYRFGALSGYIDPDGQPVSQPVKLSDTVISFHLPESFYHQIPNDPYGSCTLTVTTFSGTGQIGSSKSAVFRASADPAACTPGVSGQVTDINEATLALTGDAKKLVRFLSRAKCVLTAQAKKGASIAKTTIGGVSARQLEIAGVETADILFSVTDSRGFSASAKDAGITLIPYRKLTLHPACKRTAPTSESGILTVKGEWFSGSFGVKENGLQLSCQIDGGETVAMEASVSDGQYEAQLTVSGLDYTSAHTVTVTAQDALMQVSKTLTVQKGIPVFDWGEGDFAFHVPVDLNGIYIRKKRVWDANKTFFLQTKYDNFTGGGNRQPIFLFGTADSTNPIMGLLVVNSAGVCTWTGTGAITAQKADNTGGITVTLPAGAYDEFILIASGRIE